MVTLKVSKEISKGLFSRAGHMHKIAEEKIAN
jgi:hypothetical protein